MLRARIFFVYGRAADRPAADGSRAARENGCVQSNTRGATRERHAKEGKKVISLFLGEKIGRMFACSPSGGGGRSTAVAALGYGTAAKRRAQLRHGVEHGWKSSLWWPDTLAACGRSSLSSLYTLDTYVGAQSGRNR